MSNVIERLWSTEDAGIATGRARVLAEIETGLVPLGLATPMMAIVNSLSWPGRADVPVSTFAAAMQGNPALAALLANDTLRVDVQDGHLTKPDETATYGMMWALRLIRNPLYITALGSLITGWWVSAGQTTSAPSAQVLVFDPGRSNLVYYERNAVRYWPNPAGLRFRKARFAGI